MNPLVSVIIPVYHVEKYLNQCINSILNQTYKNIEVILIDDGGDDLCPSICEQYTKFDKRVVCIHKKNEGQAFSRKCGFEISKGEYIMFVDSDDWLDEEAIEKCLSVISDYDIVLFGYKRVYSRKVFETHLFETS